MVLSIQYLRGIAALTVFLSHSVWFINGFYAEQNIGTMLFSQYAFGVDLFFVISGFIICISSEKESSPVRFIIKRLFRIYPVLITMVVALAVYNKLSFNKDNIFLVIRSFLPLHANYNESPPFFGYNFFGPAWTLTYEVFFYAMFALTFVLKNNTRRWLYCSILCLFVASAIQLSFTGGVSLVNYREIVPHVPYFKWILSIASSPMIVNFVYGMIAYALYKSFPVRFNNDSLKYIIAFLFFLSCVVVQTGIMMPHHNPMDFGFQFLHGPRKWGLVAFIMVTTAVLYEKLYGIKRFEPLKKMGDISYSFYLFQIFTFSIMSRIGDKYEIHGFSQVLLALFLNLAASSVIFRIIEKPSVKISRKILEKL